MIIGLMGFELDSANKGCEALGYSFVEILSEILNEEFTVYNFSNLGLGEFPNLYKNISFKQIQLKIKDFKFATFKAMKECDLIYDVTLGDSFSDIYSKDQITDNLKFKEMAIFSKTPYILLPQTYGPFKNKKIKALAKHVIKKSTLVYSRDTLSSEYIKSFVNRDIFDATDIAFVLPYNRKDCLQKERINVGINISGLLWKGGFSTDNQFGLSVDYQKYTREILQRLEEYGNYNIHLIPHVIDLNKDAHDDDYKTCVKISEEFNSITIPDPFKNPIEVKSYISEMDVFVGARMHSTIGAFSAGIPTIPFSYSRKFEGLYNSLNYPYIIRGNEMNTEKAVEKTIEWISERDTLKKRVDISMRIINEKIDKFKMSIRDNIARIKQL